MIILFSDFNIMNHKSSNDIYTYAPLKECLHFIVIPHSLFKKCQELEYSGFLRTRKSIILWCAKPTSLKLSSFFSPRSITYHLHTNMHSSSAVCVTSVILGVRTQLAGEGAAALTTEFCLSLLVGLALVLLRTQILHEPFFSEALANEAGECFLGGLQNVWLHFSEGKKGRIIIIIIIGAERIKRLDKIWSNLWLNSNYGNTGFFLCFFF